MKLFSDLSLLKSFHAKTVMPSWLFKVRFRNQNKFHLQDYHVKDVSVPMYKFKGVSTMYGAVPKSYPILSHDEAFVLKITYEDDHKGTVLQFIHELQKTIIDSNGLYYPLNERLIGDLDIELRNLEGKSVGMWRATNVFFLGADDVTLDYSSNDTMKYALNFGADVVKFMKYDVNLIPIVDTQLPL